MPKYVDVPEGRSLKDVARVLIAIAAADGLPGPDTETGGPDGVRFVVSDELHEAFGLYKWPDEAPEPVPVKKVVFEDAPTEDAPKPRKKKGK